MSGPKHSPETKQRFFDVLDRGCTIRAAAISVGISPSTGYNWVKNAGLAAVRATSRIYTSEEKAEFFRLLAERGNVSLVAKELGFVRVTCYKWARQAGIFTGPNIDAQRDEFLRLRSDGLTRSQAAKHVGIDKRSAQDWDKGIRKFYGGRVYPDGRVVTYSPAETIARVKRPRTTYVNDDKVDLERLERSIDSRFLCLEEREKIKDLHSAGSSIRCIAKQLNRAPSTISRELARNATTIVGYLPHGAHRQAVKRRMRPTNRKLHISGPLRDYVVAGLDKRWSPEQISNRMVKDFVSDPTMRVCTETIYQAIYAPDPRSLKHNKPLTRTGRTRRKPRRVNQRRLSRFVDPIVPIDERPVEAEEWTTARKVTQWSAPLWRR